MLVHPSMLPSFQPSMLSGNAGKWRKMMMIFLCASFWLYGSWTLLGFFHHLSFFSHHEFPFSSRQKGMRDVLYVLYVSHLMRGKRFGKRTNLDFSNSLFLLSKNVIILSLSSSSSRSVITLTFFLISLPLVLPWCVNSERKKSSQTNG